MPAQPKTPPPAIDPARIRSADNAISLADFYAVPESNKFMFMPTRTLWPTESVDGILPAVTMPYKHNGKWVKLKPSAWLKQFRRADQVTWAPGSPEIIEDQLISDGGWRERPGARALNLYLPPALVLGDANRADPWVKHLERLYPDEAEHIANWLAHRQQHPEQKPNHALVLGGGQGIGKDTLLAPVKAAVGAWNFKEVSPTNLLEPFNPFVRAVVLRMNEAHDLGESERTNRFALYERVKQYAATPPEVLACNEKHLRQYYVPNVLGLIITTNHKTGGVYLPSDDRRHYIAWSRCTKEEFTAEYFNALWGWLLYEGGNADVAAYLMQRDLSTFDPCALPPQTAAFFEIVNAARSPEDAELADALDELEQPEACTLLSVLACSAGAAMEWLLDKRYRRSIPHRMERCGYIACRNPDTADGHWRVNDRRQVIYVKESLPPEQQLRAAQDYVLKRNKPAGTS